MALKLDESVLSACKSNEKSKGPKPVYLGAIKHTHPDYKFIVEAKAEVEKKGTRFQDFLINALKAASGLKVEQSEEEKSKDKKAE